MMTGLGRHGEAVAQLPGDLASIVATVQGLLLHEGWAARYGVEAAVPDTANLRRTEELLDAAGDRPLGQAREPADRVLTMCRSFTVVTVAMLRAHGVEARARSGFAAYFEPCFFADHWVVELRDGDRWRMADPQIDALQRDDLELGFDPLDVPADQFLAGPDAWRLIRAHGADPHTFGFSPLKLSGSWFVAGAVVRDRAALDGVETLPWDVWDPMPGPDDPVDLARFDRIAAGEEPLRTPEKVLNVRRGVVESLVSR